MAVQQNVFDKYRLCPNCKGVDLVYHAAFPLVVTLTPNGELIEFKKKRKGAGIRKLNSVERAHLVEEAIEDNPDMVIFECQECGWRSGYVQYDDNGNVIEEDDPEIRKV